MLLSSSTNLRLSALPRYNNFFFKFSIFCIHWSIYKSNLPLEDLFNVKVLMDTAGSSCSSFSRLIKDWYFRGGINKPHLFFMICVNQGALCHPAPASFWEFSEKLSWAVFIDILKSGIQRPYQAWNSSQKYTVLIMKFLTGWTYHLLFKSLDNSNSFSFLGFIHRFSAWSTSHCIPNPSSS